MRYFNISRSCDLFVILLGLTLLFVYPAQALTNDLFSQELWYIDKIQAGDVQIDSTHRPIVAILDAGFDLDHEDLSNQYWKNVHEVAGDQKDNDSNGYEDDVIGWDFVDNDPDPSSDLTEPIRDAVASHGTVIAGIISAEVNNGRGISGIAPTARIMPLRVLDKNGSGSTANLRLAVEYAVNNGAEVINLSVTFLTPDQKLLDTLIWANEQGVVIVGAVGNTNQDTRKVPVYPACYDALAGKNVIIGVGASDRFDKKASFSDYGSCVDVVAPGVNIFGAVFQDISNPFLTTAYASPWEGTSMAAPMVAAAAAAMRAQYPSLTPDQIRNAIKLSVDPVKEETVEERVRLGAGRLNVARALEVAGSMVGQRSGSSSDVRALSDGGFVIAQGEGSRPLVRRYDGHGMVLADFDAYHKAFTGGVRVAVGDVDGDGELEIVTVPGPGGGPQVRIFDQDGRPEGQFFVFDEGGRGGLYVAVGDVNGDGIDEILVNADQDSTGQVRIFNRHGHLKGAFFPLGRTATPLAVSVGNVDGDSAQEIVVSHRTTGDGTIRLFDGAGSYKRSFVVDAGNGGSLTTVVGDLDGDNVSEIVVAAGSGYAPKVSVYNGNGNIQQTFFAFPIDFRGGIHIALGDVDGNGLAEIYVSPESAGGPHVRMFNHEANLIGSFFAFDPQSRYGTFISM